jgi:hypothetical protein
MFISPESTPGTWQGHDEAIEEPMPDRQRGAKHEIKLLPPLLTAE